MPEDYVVLAVCCCKLEAGNTVRSWRRGRAVIFGVRGVVWVDELALEEIEASRPRNHTTIYGGSRWVGECAKRRLTVNCRVLTVRFLNGVHVWLICAWRVNVKRNAVCGIRGNYLLDCLRRRVEGIIGAVSRGTRAVDGYAAAHVIELNEDVRMQVWWRPKCGSRRSTQEALPGVHTPSFTAASQ